LKHELSNVPMHPVTWNIWDNNAAHLLAQETAQTAFQAWKQSNLSQPFSECVLQQVVKS
jgi:hypothetical protein